MIRANLKSTSLFNTCLKKEDIPSDIISIALLQSCKGRSKNKKKKSSIFDTQVEA